MVVMYTYIGAGAILGFVAFIGLLESSGMGKILWRDEQFTPNGLLKYIKSPFFQPYLWYWKLWRHNWILMTGMGGALGVVYSYYFG